MEVIHNQSAIDFKKAEIIVIPRKVTPNVLLEKELLLETNQSNKPKINAVSKAQLKSPSKPILSKTMQLRPIRTFGVMLKNIQVEDAAFENRKIRGFPHSQFEIQEKGGKKNLFCLVGNIMGSRYDLSCQGVQKMSIIFQVGCGAMQTRCRRYHLYILRPNIDWTSLQGHDKSEDLQQLYEHFGNTDKIFKISNQEPFHSVQNGSLALRFSKNYVMPCVQNTVAADQNGQEVIELLKLKDEPETFQIKRAGHILEEWALAFSIASFDFKLAIE